MIYDASVEKRIIITALSLLRYFLYLFECFLLSWNRCSMRVCDSPSSNNSPDIIFYQTMNFQIVCLYKSKHFTEKE